MNKVIISGAIGTLQVMEKLSKCSVACTEWKIKDEKFVPETTWINCVAFGFSAKKLAKFEKGDKVIIEGKLTVNKYNDKETNKPTYYTNVLVDRIERTHAKNPSNNSSSYLNGLDGNNAPSDSEIDALIDANNPITNNDTDDIPW